MGQGTVFYPNDPYFSYDVTARPGFPGQWHLFNQAPSSIYFTSVSWGQTVQMINAGVDANLKTAWNLGYTGRGVVIGIVDDGVDGANYDIAPGYRSDLSRNFSDNAAVAAASQGPLSISNNHGTAVAGVAAARGGNFIGGTGAAPYAEIAGLRINIATATADDPRASDQNFLDAYYWKSGVNPDTGVIEAPPEIQVKNHSYGSGAFVDASPDAKLALQRTARNGVIHVFAAGNDRDTKSEDASKQYVTSNPDVIIVAALGSDGKFANYSDYGSSVFVTAPSSRSDYTGFGITTTDRTGMNSGYNVYSSSNINGDKDERFFDVDYTSTFGGTSSSSPLVSGIMALGKEANPEMDVRMAKHALVATSTVVDLTDNSDGSFGGWRTNGAGNRFNPNYGFGNINAGAFVQKVRNVAYVTEQTSVTKSAAFSTAIPDNDAAGVDKTFSLTAAEAGQPLEGVEVGLTFTHTKRGDLTAKITSPSTMQSRLFNATTLLDAGKQDTASVTDFSWTFLTNAFWGENGAGDWTLNMADVGTGNTGTWLGYDVVFRMGQMIILTPGVMTQGVDINAQSLTLLNPDTTYQIPAGRTFRVRDNVRVDGGALVVNGQITEAPGAFGNLFSLVSGTVSGNGVINASRGFYNSGGNITPGNSVGTLTINGDYHQGSQGKLTIEIASASSRDLLAVSGSANLNGTLQTSWTGGYVPALNTNFGVFLTAAGGVNNRFSRVLTNITPTIIFQPKYDDANQIYFVVERDYANDSLSLTGNQRSVGSMLNGIANTATGMSGDLNTVLSAIDALPNGGQAAAALDQLAPKGDAAISGMAVSGATFQAGNIASRLSELRFGVRGFSFSGFQYQDSDLFRTGDRLPVLLASSNVVSTDAYPAVTDEKWGMFVRGSAIIGDQKNRSEQLGYNFTNTGVTLGTDYRFTSNLIAGLMVGVNASRANLDDAGSKVKMDGINIGAYGTYYNSGFFVDGQLGCGLGRYDNTRRIVFPGLDRTAASDPRDELFTAYGGAGYDFRLGNWVMTPAMSLQYAWLTVDGYTEAGADSLNLRVDRQTTRSLQANAGGKVSYDWETNIVRVTPSIRASYVHEFSNDDQAVTAQLAQVGIPFSIRTASPQRDFVLAGGGVAGDLKNGMFLYLNYDAQIGQSDYIAHNIYGGVRIQF